MLNRAPNNTVVTQQQRGQRPSHQYQDGTETMNRGFRQPFHGEAVPAMVFGSTKDALDAGTLGVKRAGGNLQLTGGMLFDDSDCIVSFHGILPRFGD